MTAERLQEIKARLAKPTPEPFKSILEELVQAVEGQRTTPAKGRGYAKSQSTDATSAD